MAGPHACVLLPEPLTVEEQSRILVELATHIDGGDFSIDGCSFWLTFDEDYPGEFEDLAAEGLSTILGWKPRGVVGFGANCNGDRDHELLAELCIRFAERLGGIIDFGGPLRIGPDLSGATPVSARRIESPEGLPGVLYATSYEIRPGRCGTCHYGDATFLRGFLRHPSFRMVK
jgi:Family of unknown function (DUF6368)